MPRCLILLVLCNLIGTMANAAERPPNIVFIMADDK